LKAGDRNTAYFHSFASQPKRINAINLLYREDGSVCEETEDIQEEIQSFYSDLYSSEGVPNF
jgi:hypothetical protein